MNKIVDLSMEKRPVSKNPRFAVSDTGVYEYSASKHHFWFWWPHDQAVNLTLDPEKKVQVGQCVFGLAYKTKQRFRILKEAGWHNGGPNIEKKCFIFNKKVNGANIPIKIAVKYHGDVFLWIGGHMQGDEKDEKIAMLLNMVNML